MKSQPALRVFGGGVHNDEERIAERGNSESWQRGVRMQARNIARELDISYMKMARLLWEIFDTPCDGKNGPPVYTKWGYKTFTEYAGEELGLPGRKAEHFKNIWYKLAVENGGLVLTKALEDRLVALGWSKVRELVAVLTPQNAEEWIVQAEQCNYMSLAAKIMKAREQLRAAADRAAAAGEDPSEAKQAAKNTTLPPASNVICKTLYFYDDQWDNVNLALQKARTIAAARSDKQNEGYLLDLIATEYLATNNFGEQPTAAKVAMFHKMAELTGVKVVVIDPTAPIGEKIVYGVQHLEELERLSENAEGESE